LTGVEMTIDTFDTKSILSAVSPRISTTYREVLPK